MNTIRFAVSGTQLSLLGRTREQTVGSVQADSFQFTFDESWNAYGGRIAYFGADRERMKPMLLSAQAGNANVYSCFLPRSVLAELGGEGDLLISVGGSDAGGGNLRTKLYVLRMYDSGQAEIFLTAEEQQAFMQSVEAALAALEEKSIANVQLNPADELVVTLTNGTVYNLGSVRGPQGIQGIQGVQGDKGDKGDGITDAYITGEHLYLTVEKYFPEYGETGTLDIDCGKVIYRGAPGMKGETGAAGAPGADGQDGKSAYELSVDNGFSGTEAEWLASLVGAAGSDAKQIASLYAETDPGDYGKLGVIFNDNTWLRSDLKIKAKLGTTGYDMQELAEYLNGKDIASVSVDSTPGNNQGKLLIAFNDGSYLYANTKLLAVLPTGTSGINELYNMQELATLLYSKITALEARVAELEALTRVTISGTTYAYKLDAQNGKPVLVLTEVQ